MIEDYNNKETFFIYDNIAPMDGGTSDSFKAKILLVSSPRGEVSKDFEERKSLKEFSMSSFSLQEILLLN